VKVYEHGGAFTLDEIKRYVTGAPALVVVCMGVPEIEVQGGMSCANSAWAIFVLTRTVPENAGGPRDTFVMRLVEQVVATLPEQTWGHLAAQCPKNMVATNLFSTPLDKEGLALWAIRWQQLVDVPEYTSDQLHDFLVAYTEYKPTAPVDTTVESMNGHVELEPAT
jgi:hypothetical protein